jgi:hypothetical protein
LSWIVSLTTPRLGPENACLLLLQVSLKSLEDRTIKLTVYDVDRVRRHNVIGHALLPLKGRELEIISDRGLLASLDLQQSEVTEVSLTS